MSRLLRFYLAAGLLAAFVFALAALPLNAQKFLPLGCKGQPVVLLDTSNTSAVQNGPSGGLPAFTLKSPACITQVWDYHWNNGQGATPGTITLELQPTRTTAAHNYSFNARGPGSSNVNWTAQPNPPTAVPAGTYSVADSNPATWSRNQQSAYRFFTKVIGICAAPATGNGCIGQIITPIASNPGPTPGPKPSGPISTPMPTAKPCHYTTNAMVEELTPGCFGGVGTPITLVVVRALPAMPSGIVFKQGPIGMGSGLPAPANLVLVEVKIAGTTRTGNGMAAGSTFTFPAPAALCTNATTKPIGSARRIAWDVFVAGPTGATISGDVDDFVIDCP